MHEKGVRSLQLSRGIYGYKWIVLPHVDVPAAKAPDPVGTGLWNYSRVIRVWKDGVS
jgi:hypothetical protein